MSRYTVVWLEEALDELAEIWLNSQDRNSIVQAAAEVDRRLGDDPVQHGTSLAEGLRKLSIPPLHVLFVVREADRVAEIETVKVRPPPP